MFTKVCVYAIKLSKSIFSEIVSKLNSNLTAFLLFESNFLFFKKIFGIVSSGQNHKCYDRSKIKCDCVL